MVNFTFRGHMAPVFTPFNNDTNRSLNLEKIPEYAKYLADKGIKGLLVNGTSGEGMSMNVVERKLVTEEWVKACKQNNQTIMVQIGGAPLPDVLELARHAEGQKVDAILCLPELYSKPKSAKDLMKYLSIVSKAASKTPLLYYHIPSFTNVNINMPDFLTKVNARANAKTENLDNLVGIKFTSVDLVEGAECLKVANGKYAIFLGADQILAAAYTLGFDSAIATTFNFIPELGYKIQQSLKRSKTNLEAAQKAQNQLTEYVNSIIKHGTWVSTMKTAMNLKSTIDVGPVREPLEKLDKTQKNEMKDALM